jgi:hypothetical protein
LPEIAPTHLRLIDRKTRLRSIVREKAGRTLYAGHIEERGEVIAPE